MSEIFQRPISEYKDIRKYVHFHINNLKDALWQSGTMTKECYDQLAELEAYEEKVHCEVLELYAAYTNTLQALKEVQA